MGLGPTRWRRQRPALQPELSRRVSKVVYQTLVLMVQVNKSKECPLSAEKSTLSGKHIALLTA